MKSKIKNMDKFLFLLIIIYTIIGLVMVFSSSSMTAVLQYNQSESFFFQKQLKAIIIGYALGFFILFIMPYNLIRFSKKCTKILILVSVSLLMLTLTAGITRNGVTSWFAVGGHSFQPSEFVKTMVILFLAFTFRNPKRAFIKNKYLLSFIFGIICVFLIMAQPDFGTGMILGIIVFIMFLFVPYKDKTLKIAKLVSCIGVCIAVCLFLFGGNLFKEHNILHFSKEQLDRFIYNDPCTRYTEKTGYQVCNGFIAINNGGLFGAGLGNSKQKYLYLPEAYTDFVFPIIVEELGSIGGSVIIIGFMVMLGLLLKIARQSETLTGSMLAIGTFAYILGHLVINLLGVLSIIPLTGVPLPFLSYGGTFNLNLIVLLFICERVTVESKNRKLKREIESL